MRTDRIPLAADEPRCEPSHGCTMLTKCSRSMATIPAGARLVDYTEALGEKAHARCVHYVCATSAFLMAAPRRKAVR